MTARDAGRRGRPLRAIVVDDDLAVAALHMRFVEAHPDFEVVATAHTGPAAFEKILEHSPDLVLLDFYLPGRSGLDVLREIRSAKGRQPEFIAVTAARDAVSVRQARVAGVRHYLVKPFTASDLRARLDDIVRDRGMLERTALDEGLDQNDIDALMTGGIRQPVPLPKGLSADTLGAITSALREAPDSSATEIGAIAGVSRVSSRRYLEYLVLARRAERALDYGTAGRPSSRYRPAGSPPTA